MDVSDRILVMYEGELVGQLDPKTVLSKNSVSTWQVQNGSGSRRSIKER